ncbi:MAG: hypothetical protein U9N77_10480 [Thermodesulfobacteriota bacterium]|nr:hypothetical protein [Thermodesulfobacteriota bacterium]
MEEKMIKKIELDNGQTLELFDCSKKIADDAVVVRMSARIKVDVKEDLFSKEDLKEISFKDILNKVGDSALFEYKAERNFIMNPDKEAVFQKLVDTFFENMVQYLSKSEFPKKLILKQYRD